MAMRGGGLSSSISIFLSLALQLSLFLVVFVFRSVTPGVGEDFFERGEGRSNWFSGAAGSGVCRGFCFWGACSSCVPSRQ